MSTGDIGSGAPEGAPAASVPAQAGTSSTVDWINVVTAYGADPTGSTAAINTALPQAQPGQPAYLPRGTYKTTAARVPGDGVNYLAPTASVMTGRRPTCLSPAACPRRAPRRARQSPR